MSVLPTSSETSAGDRPIGGRPAATPGDVGLYVFLTSLGIAFAAAIIAYLTARTGAMFHQVRSAEGVGTMTMPTWFWFSTFFILLASVVLHYAKVASGGDRPLRARRALWGAMASSWVFLALQVPGLVELVRTHRVMLEIDVRIYALLILLVVMHALHVAGGLVPMTVLGLTARRRPVDVDRYPAMRRMTIYWHFLAIVWLVMFNGMLLVG